MPFKGSEVGSLHVLSKEPTPERQLCPEREILSRGRSPSSPHGAN
jgi:hypothetical protein